ncbi:MAG: acetylglutamate kinase [Treponema sp.]|jgi:acetylglutamate kinase|nr:acetylglutamate kinase [Treponema sp.]
MKGTISVADRATVMIQALPYIHQFQGKTVVVKYGGNAMINEELKTAVIEDLVFMACAGIRTVLVHGGGPEIEAMLKKLGKESRFVDGLRYTDEETMEVVQMVLCGKVNKDLTAMIQKQGGRAIGLCGLDGAMLHARRLRGKEDLGLVGEIETVDAYFINVVLDSGAIPVISSVAYNIGEGLNPKPGGALNINADLAAAKIAVALKAEKIILMTDVKGILRDVNDPDSLIGVVRRSELERLKMDGIVNKGMIPKVDCCSLAMDGGVKKAHILDGRVPHALLIELFTDEGIGTMLQGESDE